MSSAQSYLNIKNMSSVGPLEMTSQFSARHRGCVFSGWAECLLWAVWQGPRSKLDTSSVTGAHDLWERDCPGRMSPECWEHT